MSLASNVWKIVATRIVTNFLIIMPIFVLFLQDKGLSLFELFLLQSIFSLVLVLWEIPSGYFSDRLGRKKTMLLGSVFFVGCTALYAFGDSFWLFALAEALGGIGAGFFSGTDSALLFETLDELKRTKQYKRWEGKSELFNRVSEAVAAILGGILGAVSLQWPFWVWFGISLLTIPLTLSMTEPPRTHLKHAKSAWKGIVEIVRFSMHQNKTVKWLLLFSSFIGFATLSSVWLSQPYYQLVGLPVFLFGIVWALSNLSSGFFSYWSESVENQLGKKKFFWLLPGILVVSFLFLGFVAVLPFILFTFTAQMVRGLKKPVVWHYLNSEISSEKRATVLSVDGLLTRLMFAVLSPFLGILADSAGVQIAFLALAGFSLATGLLSVWRLQAHTVIG